MSNENKTADLIKLEIRRPEHRPGSVNQVMGTITARILAALLVMMVLYGQSYGRQQK